MALSAPLPLYPLPDDVLNVIHAYLNKHINSDDHDSQRLHDELLSLHESKVRNRPENHATFLACFRALRPGLIGVERLLKWWDTLVRPTLDSMGQAKLVVADARAIVLSVLAYDDEDDPTGEKAKASAVFTDKLFEVFLEKTKLISSDRGAGFKEEQRQRFVSANVEAVLLAFGKRKPKVSYGSAELQMIKADTENRYSSRRSIATWYRRSIGCKSWACCAALCGYRGHISTRSCRPNYSITFYNVSKTIHPLQSYPWL